jgi:hypothetical protein
MILSNEFVVLAENPAMFRIGTIVIGGRMIPPENLSYVKGT